MFQDMANFHGNLMGKNKRLAWSFIGAINAFISLAFNGTIERDSLKEGISKIGRRPLIFKP